MGPFQSQLSRANTVGCREAWLQHRARFCSEALHCAESYWNATGDPLFALEILNDAPYFTEDDSVATTRYMELAQTVVDDLERELLWERVYPADFPVGARWKEAFLSETLAEGRDTWPGVLVDRGDNGEGEHVLLRVGEWESGKTPCSRDLIIPVHGSEWDSISVGDYVQVLCARERLTFVAVECRPDPPEANLRDTRAAVRRLWDALAQGAP